MALRKKAPPENFCCFLDGVIVLNLVHHAKRTVGSMDRSTEPLSPKVSTWAE